MSQIALPLTLAGAAARRVVIGPSNRAVADALADPSRWPFRTAILAGPPGSGKTLLANWFEAAGLGQAIDDADRADETELFHRWNRAQQDGTALLLTVGEGGWPIALPDLRSRMGAALPLAIGAPDDAEAGELLVAMAAARGLALGEGAAGYLVPRIERSHAGIARIVAEIDRISLERMAPATLSVWRDALEAVQGPEQGRLL